MRRSFPHVVYESVEEAREDGIEPVPWRECRGVGVWMAADDGYVAEVLKFYPTNKGKNRTWAKWARLRSASRQNTGEVVSVLGRGFTHQKNPFLSFQKRTSKNLVRQLRAARGRAMITLYCSMLINGRKIDYLRLTRVLYFNCTYSEKFIKLLLKKEETQVMIREELTRQLNDGGFSFKEVLEEYKGLIALCKTEKDLQNLRLTLDKFVELHDALPAKKTMSMNFPQGSIGTGDHPVEDQPLLSPAEENEAAEEMEKVLAQRSVDLLNKGAAAEVIE